MLKETMQKSIRLALSSQSTVTGQLNRQRTVAGKKFMMCTHTIGFQVSKSAINDLIFNLVTMEGVHLEQSTASRSTGPTPQSFVTNSTDVVTELSE